MKLAIDETDRRRAIQEAYNEEHGIVPATVIRAVMNINPAAGHHGLLRDPEDPEGRQERQGRRTSTSSEQIRAMRAEMFTAAEALDFERAARLRDELKRLEGLAGKDGVGARRRRRLRPVRGRHEEGEVAQLARREQLEQRREQGEGEQRRPRPLQALRGPRSRPEWVAGGARSDA